MVRWRSGRRSDNVEDRRGMRPAGVVGGGIGLLVVALLVWVLGGDPVALLEQAGDGAGTSVTPGPAGPPPPDDEEGQFASAILASTEDVWTQVFADYDASYQPPTLVLFTDVVQSGCGRAGSETGPFYCPRDQKVYLDLSFFRELARLGGPGDFAAAYVIGHEVGHHVQNITGDLQRMDDQARARPDQQAALSVAFELQADCYAGLWAHHANRTGTFLEPGDVEEGLNAAQAIGDDRLAEMSGRAVQPESFTHGSAEQRARWLRTGLEQGTVEACETRR